MADAEPPLIACLVRPERARDRPVVAYQVLGERCSGTNFLDMLLFRNAGLRREKWQSWKHGFPDFVALPDDGLVVVVVRNAFDWVRSLYRRPWHSSALLRQLPFSDFLRARWECVVDHSLYFHLPDGDPRVGRLLQFDRHPITGQGFANLIQLRNTKLSAHLGLLNRNINVAIVTHEALSADPVRFLRELSATFGLTLAETIRVPEEHFGSEWPHRDQRIQVPETLSERDRYFIAEEIDAAQEFAFGYRYP